MATNYVQDGNSIDIVNAQMDIASGDPVVIGGMIAVAVVDIKKGAMGTGLTSGVFLLPKLAGDAIPAGTLVYLSDGLIQLDDEDAVAAGHAWRVAGENATVVEVKING